MWWRTLGDAWTCIRSSGLAPIFTYLAVDTAGNVAQRAIFHREVNRMPAQVYLTAHSSVQYNPCDADLQL